jgi:hypothetical protein
MKHTICPAWRMAPHKPPYHKKECEDIQCLVVSAILPKMGIFHNTARTVVFGSATYCGLGLYHLATVQKFSRLQYIIGHIRSKIITSKLIRQQLDYTQLDIGCPTQVLSQDYNRYIHIILCPKWIVAIWESLHAFKASGSINLEWIPHLARLGDILIMEILTAYKSVKHINLSAINICRIYLGVFFISDMVNI